MTHTLLRDRDVEDLRRAEERHLRRIRDRQKARDRRRWLADLRDDHEERESA